MKTMDEVTVAGIHGACEQIANHLRDKLCFDKVRWTITQSRSSIDIYISGEDDFAPKDKYGFKKQVTVYLATNGGDDWREVTAKLWAQVAKIGARERRELEQTMKVLGLSLIHI